MSRATPIITYSLLVCYTIVVVLMKISSAFDSHFFFGAYMLLGICSAITFLGGIGLCVFALIQRESLSFRIIAPLWMVLLVISAMYMPGYNFLEKMARHYENHHEDIAELRHYAATVLDDSCYLQLEVGKKSHINMFACATKEGDLKWHDNDYKQVMPSIGLSDNELDSVVLLLRKSDCIGLIIFDHRVREIWFRRPGVMDLYSYYIYDHPMIVEQWNGFIHSYSSVPYCDTVAFHYGGGAFGSDMIPEEDKKSFMRHHNIQEIAVP